MVDSEELAKRRTQGPIFAKRGSRKQRRGDWKRNKIIVLTGIGATPFQFIETY